MSVLDWFKGRYTPDVLGAILGIAAATKSTPEPPPEPPPVPQEVSQLSCMNLITGKHHVAARDYSEAKFIGDNTWVIVYRTGHSEAYVGEPGESCFRVRENLEG